MVQGAAQKVGEPLLQLQPSWKMLMQAASGMLSATAHQASVPAVGELRDPPAIDQTNDDPTEI